MKKLLYGLVALVVLLVGAAFIVPSLIDFNAYKGEIQQKARAATGRDLLIDGPIKLAILPSPQLSAEGVRFANLPGSDSKDMAQLKSLKVNVALLPLISGNVEVTQVTLVGATVVLETLPDGRNNWELGGAKPQGGVAGAATGTPPANDASSSAGISIKDLAIEDSTLIWRDLRAGKSVRLDALNGRLSADTLEGPFTARLSFKAGQVPVDLEARSGALGDAAMPLLAVLKTNGGELRFDGKVADAKSDPKLEGTFRGAGDSLAALLQSLAALSGSQPPALPPSLAQKFTLDANVSGSRQSVALRGLKIDLGGDTGSGDVALRFGPPLRADLKLAFAKLDVDKLLAGAKPATPPPAAPTTPAPNPAAPPPATASTGIPSNVEGSLDISVGTIVYQGKTAQNVTLKGDLSKGTLTIASIGGQFPGNTAIAASGSVGGGRGGAGSGRVEIRSTKLREFLTWLDVDTSTVPAERLNGFAFTGQIAATAEGDLQIANAVMQLDGTTAKGAVTIKTAPKPAIVADLDIDTLNVDAYVGQSRAPRPANDKAPASGGSPIDAVVKARVAHLIVQGTQIDGIDVDVTVAPDRLTFRPSKIASAGGARASWSGTVAGYGSATPVVDLTLDLQTQDAERLLQLAGVAPPLKNQRLGALSASGRIAGKSDDLTFTNFGLTTLGATVRLTGKLALGAQGPSYNFSHLEVKADDGDRLLGVLGVASPAPGQKLGPVTLSGAARGNLDQATIDLDLNALNAALDVKGSLGNLRATPTLALDLALNHPNFQQLVRLFSPTFRGGQNAGAVKLQMRIDGSPGRELRITNLRGNIGPTQISGTINANLAGAVPNVTASLETGELDLDKILVGPKAELPRLYPAKVLPASLGDPQLAQTSPYQPPPLKGAPPPKPATPQNAPRSGGGNAGRGSHFSSQTLDVASLRSIDAKIDLKSQALVLAPWRVDNAVADIDLRGGMLHVSRLTGRAFDGEFSLTGALNASKLPAALDVKFSVVKLDLGRLSRAIHHKDRFDGDVNVDFALAANGSSEAELVNNLNGSGNVGGTVQFNAKVQEFLLGTVAGVAGKTVDKFLGKFTGQKGFDTGGDASAAISVALQRFANRENPISGAIVMRNGVASSTNLRVVGRQARADTNFTANLNAWTLDATTNVFLDENPSQPYLIVKNVGALDDPNLSVDRNPNYAGANPAPGDQPQQQAPAPADQQAPKPKKLSPLDLFKKK